MPLYLPVLLLGLLNFLNPTDARSCPEEETYAVELYQDILRSDGVLEAFYIPLCQGNLWEPLQTNSDNLRWCVDPTTGENLTKASVQLESCGGCLAKRLSILLEVEKIEEAGGTTSNIYIPECQNDFPDLYENTQCWIGYFNACWCVNTTTGEAMSLPQTSQELQCGSHGRTIPWCFTLQFLVNNYFHAYHKVKEANNGFDFKPDIQFQLHCDKFGLFEKRQCIGDACWCVDATNGYILDSTDCLSLSKYTDTCHQHKDEQFEVYYYLAVRGVMLEQFTIPHCTNAGTWEYIQCTNQTLSGDPVCWCVDNATGEPTTPATRELRSCSSCRASQLRNSKIDVNDMTTCDESGKLFTLIQCNKDNDCWCVDPVTGAVILEGEDMTGAKCESHLKTISYFKHVY